jgi:4-hydroxy-2-oxoheptanedioate aldolase
MDGSGLDSTPALGSARPNRLKHLLEAGEVATGCLLAYNAPWLVEVLGATGYDFVTIDLEHEPFNDESVANLIRAADAAGLTTIVRMPATERLVPFLSAGAQGVLIPDLRDAAHARHVVELTRFAPRGRRTYYTHTRSGGYGVELDEQTWTQEADEQLLVFGMIEHIELVEQLDELLAVDGIDGFHIGPLDLAQSLGSPPPEELEEIIEDVVRRCRAAGRFAAVGLVTPWNLDGIAGRLAQGIQMLSVPSTWLLTQAMGSFLEEIESHVPVARRSPRARTVTPNRYLSTRPE